VAGRERLMQHGRMSLFKRHDHAVPPVAELVVPPVPDGTPIEFPIWPTGIARYADGILEVTTGEGLRVAARDLISVEVKPPRAGRLTMKVAYRAGFNTNKRSFWVEMPNEIALHQLVGAAQGARAAA